MTVKTDAEFIAECEAHDQEMLDRWFCGDSTLTTDMGLDFGFTRAALTEAVERLKRANEGLRAAFDAGHKEGARSISRQVNEPTFHKHGCGQVLFCTLNAETDAAFEAHVKESGILKART